MTTKSTNQVTNVNQIKLIQPGAQYEIDADLQVVIESAILTKKSRPLICPGLGGGAVYTLREFNPNSPVFAELQKLETAHTGYSVQYDDMDTAWYAYLQLVRTYN